MSVDRDDFELGVRAGAGPLLARAAAADVRAERRLAAFTHDLSAAHDLRLDDEVRAFALAIAARLIATIENDIRLHASRLLSSKGAEALAPVGGIVDRLIAAGLLQDAALVEELVARAWCDIIAARLPIAAREDAERPSLLPRLANGPDRVIASAASAAMAADVRRQGRDADAGRNDLPAELHHRLVWWVAASLRPSSAPATTDAALTDAARRALAAHDEGARLEAATGRLAAALDPDLSELPALVEEAFEDRRLVLVIALLAQGLSIDADLARQIVLDPEGDRLWLALRALDFSRAGIARIALALGEADRRRDAERFIESIDPLMAMPIRAAQEIFAKYRLPKDYRAAASAIERLQ